MNWQLSILFFVSMLVQRLFEIELKFYLVQHCFFLGWRLALLSVIADDLFKWR